MVKDVHDQLTRMHGIGPTLAGRLVAAGFETFAQVAAAGEERLKSVKGMNPRSIPSILAQAREFASGAEEDHERFLRDLKARAAAVTTRIVALAADIRERFSGDMTGRHAAKIEKEIFQIIAALEILSARSWKKGKRAAKCLSRTEEQLSEFSGSDMEDMRRGLKKMRKILKRIDA